jgi:hypothetical protein
VTGVDTGGQAAYRAALAGGVEPFEENHQTRRLDVGLEQARGKESKLRKTMLSGRDSIGGLRFVHR